MFQKRIDDLWQNLYGMDEEWFHLGHSFPAVNIYEAKDYLLVVSALPGVQSEDVDITLSGDILTMEGKTQKLQDSKSLAKYFHNERKIGSFRKEIPLPFVPPADSKVDANLENGLLQIKLPIPAESQPRKIEVNL